MVTTTEEVKYEKTINSKFRRNNIELNRIKLYPELNPVAKINLTNFLSVFKIFIQLFSAIIEFFIADIFLDVF